MKKRALSLLLALTMALALLPTAALAADKDFTIQGGVLVKYNGSGGAVTIPSGVTSIGEYAFHNCKTLTSVSIPNGVTSIGKYAFCDCSALTSVTIPNSVTSIGYDAFGCSGLTSITIPSGVTSIEEYTFYSCGALTSVTIPDSVTSIGSDAFMDCTNLTSVTIPDSVTSIGIAAFMGCTNLTSITIPNSVTSIGVRTFYGCKALLSVTIPNSVTSIGKEAFEYCEALTSITIPDSVNSIEPEAFVYSGLTAIQVEAGNRKYTSVDGVLFTKDRKTLLNYPVGRVGPYLISDGVTGIGDYAFFSCRALTSLTIPDSVTSIGDRAFNCKDVYYCGTEAQWRAIPLGKSVGDNSTLHYNSPAMTTDGDFTIQGGVLVKYNGPGGAVTIPDGVTGIGPSAFAGCKALTSVTIPNSVTCIGSSAFSGTGLTGVTIPSSVTAIGDSAFSGCDGLTGVTIGNSVSRIGAQAFWHCAGLTSVIIPNSVEKIEASAFSGTGLTSVTIPSGVYMEADAFNVKDVYYCGIEYSWYYMLEGRKAGAVVGYDAVIHYNSPLPALANKDFTVENGVLVKYSGRDEAITIPDNVTSIGKDAFFFNSNATSIVIPDGVTSIETYAIYGCYSLTSVTIPASVTSIGPYAFSECYALTDVYYGGSAEQWAAIDIARISLSSTVTIHYSGSTAQPSAPTAVETTQTVNVDGKDVTFYTYALVNENGGLTNYAKLRDVAAILNGTKGQFSVGWNGAINLETGKPYTMVDGDLQKTFVGDQPYVLGATQVNVNGSPADLQAITLVDANGGNYNYFELRKLGQALGFNVGWSREKGVFIETDKPYTDAD